MVLKYIANVLLRERLQGEMFFIHNREKQGFSFTFRCLYLFRAITNSIPFFISFIEKLHGETKSHYRIM